MSEILLTFALSLRERVKTKAEEISSAFKIILTFVRLASITLSVTNVLQILLQSCLQNS